MKTEIIVCDPENFTENELLCAADSIKRGGIVAFPTETVYGLGGSGLSDLAVAKIYEAKGRPSNNPLILHFASVDDISGFAECSNDFFKLATAFMPGPLTVVLPSKKRCAPAVTAGLDTVAVRVPIHPVARALIKLSGVPIAAPSANISGRPSPTDFSHVYYDLNEKVDAIIDGGECSVGLESTIVKLGDEGATLLRPGAITLEMLKEVLGEVKVAPEVLAEPKKDSVPLSPGMLFKHYAPNAPLFLIRTRDKSKLASYMEELAENAENAVICYDGDVEEQNNVFYLGKREDKLSQAKNLFSLLRKADGTKPKRIYAPMPDTDGIGLALVNRMLRAAAFKIKDI